MGSRHPVLQKLVELLTTLSPGSRRQGDKTVSRVVSVRAERCGAWPLPKEGKAFYETTFGPLADKLLQDARKSGDAGLFLQAAQRYPLLKAADTALEELAQLDEKSGQVGRGALALNRLLQRPLAGELVAGTTLPGGPALHAGRRRRYRKCGQGPQ